jgi:hypothetical protein
MAATQGKEKPMAQKASVAHQTASPSTPQANLRHARAADTAPRNPRLARGRGAPSSEFLPRSRVLAPRVSLRLAQASLSPRRRACSPDQGIKSSDTSRAPGSMSIPRHTGLLTPPGN